MIVEQVWTGNAYRNFNYLVACPETGDALAHETIIAGEVLDEDVRAEVMLLRAELDMLKRAFRRHCADQ